MISLGLEGISAGYGRHRILDSFSVRPLTGGRVVGLLGPNASGKSTLMKSIAGVHRTVNGSVELTIGDQVISGRDLRDHIGYVPQDLPKSAALTAFETVIVAARRHFGTRVAQLLAAEIMHELGLEDLAHVCLSDMSGGQRQMVAVAQMLVTDPTVMLLDEPTSALDLHRQLFLFELLRKRVRDMRGIALIAIHDINLAARFCDELVVMKEGQLVEQGSPDEIVTAELIDAVYQVEAQILQHEGSPVLCF
ncbi:ABC transporter ATP-binding protein [Corynebacterium sp. H130]|uniref:ABC transporter ATP-binding protein n=1 Tax=Corynebacterium sp. H130 TaxID=3133444 RepID=UPI0030ABD2A8